MSVTHDEAATFRDHPEPVRGFSLPTGFHPLCGVVWKGEQRRAGALLTASCLRIYWIRRKSSGANWRGGPP